MNLNDLQNIDFKNVGSLPLAIKGVLLLIVLVGITAAGGWFVWKPMLDELETAKNEEWGPDKNSGLRGTFEAKLGQAANLAAYKAQLKDAEMKSSNLLKQLPDKSQMEGLLTDINQAGIGRGLEFDLFRPGGEKPAALYAEMPITIRVFGNYHDLGAFAADVAKMSRIVTLSEISISGNSKAAGKDGKVVAQDKLMMDAVAKTYRALDKSEAPAPSKNKKKPAKKNAAAESKGGHP